MTTPTRIPMHDFQAQCAMADQLCAQNYPHDVWVQVKHPDVTKQDKNIESRERRRIETALLECVNTTNSDPILRQVIALIQSYPLKPKWNQQVMSTDGMATFFNPFVTEVLSKSEVVAVCIHECGHQLYGDVVNHMTMEENYQNIFWAIPEESTTPDWANWLANIFIDPVVDRLAITANSPLVDTKFLQDHIKRIYILMDHVLTPCVKAGFSTDDMVLDALVSNGQWDAIYDGMEQNAGTQAKHDKWQILHKLALLMARTYEGSPASRDGGLGDVATNPNNNKNSVKTKQEAAVTNACKQAGVGTAGYGLEIPEPEPSNRVQDHLPEIISGMYEAMSYSYEQVDPVLAQEDVYLPEKVEPPGVVCVLLDVSGSVVYDPSSFPVLLGELSAALTDPRISSVVLIPYDWGDPDPENVVWLEPGEEITQSLSNMSGGGGTSFTEAFKYAEEHEDAAEFACIINLTDGWADFQADPDWTIPRIWVSTDRETYEMDESATHVVLPNRKYEAIGDDDDE